MSPGPGSAVVRLPTCPVSCLSSLPLEMAAEQGGWHCSGMSPSHLPATSAMPRRGDATGRLKAKDVTAGHRLALSFLLQFWGLVTNLGSDPSFLQPAPRCGWLRLGDGSGAVRPAHPRGSAVTLVR